MQVKRDIQIEDGVWIRGNMRLKIHALLEDGEVQVMVPRSTNHNIYNQPIVTIVTDNLELWWEKPPRKKKKDVEKNDDKNKNVTTPEMKDVEEKPPSPYHWFTSKVLRCVSLCLSLTFVCVCVRAEEPGPDRPGCRSVERT